jgi:hypothetical protein
MMRPTPSTRACRFAILSIIVAIFADPVASRWRGSGVFMPKPLFRSLIIPITCHIKQLCGEYRVSSLFHRKDGWQVGFGGTDLLLWRRFWRRLCGAIPRKERYDVSRPAGQPLLAGNSRE